MSLDTENIASAINVYGEDAGEFVMLTVKDADIFVADTATAIENKDPLAAGIAAHSLKSIMRQISADDAADAAYSMEKAGKAENSELCAELLSDLQNTYKEIREYLAQNYNLE